MLGCRARTLLGDAQREIRAVDGEEQIGLGVGNRPRRLAQATQCRGTGSDCGEAHQRDLASVEQAFQAEFLQVATADPDEVHIPAACAPKCLHHVGAEEIAGFFARDDAEPEPRLAWPGA